MYTVELMRRQQNQAMQPHTQAPHESPLIRRALPADLPALRRMAQAFHSASCYAQNVPLDLGSFAETVAGLASGTGGVVLLAERQGEPCGMAAAVAMRHWFNASHVTGQELFWWVDEGARGTGAGFALLAGLEDWARAAGCQTFCVASTANLTPEKLARVYRRRGYVPQDIFYRRTL